LRGQTLARRLPVTARGRVERSAANSVRIRLSPWRLRPPPQCSRVQRIAGPLSIGRWPNSRFHSCKAHCSGLKVVER
jgi:hypothetical protein